MRYCACAGALFAALVCTQLVRAVELDDVFPAPGTTAPTVSAESVVEAAFSNLFDFDGVARIESDQTMPDGGTQVSRFQVYRKSFEPATQRVLIATTDPDAPEQQMRMLEVIEGKERRRARLFAPRIDSEPMVTRYRITDPFMGTFSNRPPEEVRSDLSSLARAYEIIAREPATLGGAEVDRITVRPLAARGRERVELWIARDTPLILEYRYFEATSAVPARVARAPRDQMRLFQGRLLPGLMIYQDSIDQTTTRVRLRYEPLPASLGDAPFMESTFHGTRLPE